MVSRRTNQFQSGPIQEWNIENVLHWLMALELEQYTDLFREKSVTGNVLLQLDGSKLKVKRFGIDFIVHRFDIMLSIKQVTPVNTPQ